MRPVRLHVLTAIVIAMATAGCGGDAKGDSPQAGAAGTTAATTAPVAPAASASSASGMDEETKAACKNLDGDIKEARKNVAEAEKIGPPAGHHAVSAAWSAASASLTAHSIGANESVSKAVDGVSDAMSEIGDKYVNARSKPDKTAVNRAIDELKKACAVR